MRHIIAFAVFLMVQFSAQGGEIGERHFAIGFFTSGHSQMITYAMITVYKGQIISAEVVRKDRFIYTALGHWPHPINPDRENLFEKHGVDSCFLLKNEQGKVVGYYAKPFQHLWKVRFYEHPYAYDSQGWSQGQYTPSIAQKEFLRREYGVRNILTEYIYGDSLFKLLRDVQSPAWISRYKTASQDTTAGP
ncbi:MAG: hypothetical protein WDZ35_11150 [Crocinitomicaceae bacterium]